MPLPARRRGPGPGRPTARWEPFRELEDLQERTAQLLESAWSGASVNDPEVWVPPVDIEETEDAWMIEAEVPGVARDDVDVEVRDSELVISGEIKERERKGVLRRRTRRVGRFEYRVTLPAQVDPDRVEATLAEGVLTVTVPKSEQARPRRIEVEARST